MKPDIAFQFVPSIEARLQPHVFPEKITHDERADRIGGSDWPPFSLRMADAREYLVPHREYISFPPRASYVIVYDDAGRFTRFAVTHDDRAGTQSWLIRDLSTVHATV